MMLAALDQTQIIVAVLGVVGVLGAATIPVLILRAGQDDIKARVGELNGKGSLAEMNEQQLAQQDDHEAKLSKVAEKVDVIDERTLATDRKLDDHLVAFDERACVGITAQIDARADHIDETLENQNVDAAQLKADLTGNENP